MSEQLTVDANPGEVWAFSIEGEESIVGFAVVADVWGHIEFRTVLGNVLKLPTSVYTDARKIWPQEESAWTTERVRHWCNPSCPDGCERWDEVSERRVTPWVVVGKGGADDV